MRVALGLAAVLAAAQAVSLAEGARRELTERDQAFLADIGPEHELLEDLSGVFPAEHSRRLRAGGDARDDVLTYRFRALGEDREVSLRMNRKLFSPDFAHVVVGSDGRMVKDEEGSSQTECVYVSADKAGPKHLVSFCGGMVHARLEEENGGRLYVQPLPSDHTVHVAFRRSASGVRNLAEDAEGCGVEGAGVQLTDEVVRAAKIKTAAAAGKKLTEEDLKPARARGRGVQQGSGRRLATNTVSVGVINDFYRFEKMGAQTQASATQVFAGVAGYFDTLGATQTVEVVLSAMITFHDEAALHSYLGGYTYPISSAPKSSINPRSLLDAVVAMANTGATITKIEATMQAPADFDVLHLLSGRDFFIPPSKDGVIGLAYVGATCSSQNAGITQATYDNLDYITFVMTHELGHNLNMQHTDETETTMQALGEPYIGTGPAVACTSAGSPYVMFPTAPNPSSPPVWSSCSQHWFDEYTTYLAGLSPTFQCLSDGANPVPQPSCGNGVVEPGEDCDCLMGDCGSDICCNPTTCQYNLPGYTCSAADPCCDPVTCTPLTGGTASSTVCRPSADATCDPSPEVCDGENATCPVNVVAPPGTGCGANVGGGNGAGCYLGECKDWAAECTAIGSTGGTAPSVCGSLVCSGSSVSTMYMPDGHICNSGANEVCFEQSCVSASTLPTPLELSACGNGVMDADETDVDCGGPICGGCYGGQTCAVDSDCRYPGTCNATSLECVVVLGNAVPANPVTPEEDPLLSLLEDALEWVKANPAIAGGIGAGVLLLAIYFCCNPCRRRGGGGSKGKDGIRRKVVERPRSQQPQGLVAAQSYY